MPGSIPNKYPERLEIQLTKGQSDFIRRQADLFGMSLSGVMRALIEQLKTNPNSLEVARDGE
jgi:hypothetical protein